ncbi:MAG: hypothetical protein DMG61_19120 [Acidobacteria bacterium]|nr:MAG: hypothetical protein DMG61_19120 [Acidobacteriota bacterium]
MFVVTGSNRTQVKGAYLRFCASCAPLLLLCSSFFVGVDYSAAQQPQPLLIAQHTDTPDKKPAPASPSRPPQGKGDIGVRVEQASPPSERKITAEEARQLFASIDETLTWLSKDTGYAIKQKVKGELASREQVAKYVDDRLNDDEDAKRLERSEIVLKKFGLLPRDFDLHAFLIQLLQEQVAGYYDVKTKSMYLLDWLSADSQKPVLAHELTHALQDQNFDLKTWETPKAAKRSDKEEFTFDEDEAATARSAVAEGQGMVTLVDYMLRGTGHTLADAPQVATMMRSSMTGNSGFPLLERAPLMIRESLVFPYGDGLAFEAALLEKGKDTAFSGAFRRPPQNTHEILDVATYLKATPARWLVLPDLRNELGSGYEKYDEGSIGQLDTRILVEQYADKETAAKMADAWKGGVYYAAGNKDPKLKGSARIGLVYLSRWKTEDAADEFAKIYGDYLPKRYARATPLNVKDVKCGPPESCDAKTVRAFSTEEGEVWIQRVEGAGVLISEGFDGATASKLRVQVLSANPAKLIQVQMRSLMSPVRTSAIIQEAVGRIFADRLQRAMQNPSRSVN